MGIAETWNADFIDTQYKLWKSDPGRVSKDWQFFFEGFELAAAGKISDTGTEVDEEHALRQSRVQALIYRYRDIGHLMACLDPLAACPTDHPLLNLAAFNLSPEDLDRQFNTRRFSASGRASLGEILAALKETYCRSIGVEFMHLQDPAERNWLIDRMEAVRNQPMIQADVKRRILEKLIQAALFEQFLNKKYLAVTRFSLEGGEERVTARYFLLRNCSKRALFPGRRGSHHSGSGCAD